MKDVINVYLQFNFSLLRNAAMKRWQAVDGFNKEMTFTISQPLSVSLPVEFQYEAPKLLWLLELDVMLAHGLLT